MICHCKDYSVSLKTFIEINDRCHSSSRISEHLEEMASDYVKWMSVYKCRICKQFWAMEYPFGAKKGHGRPCFYHIDCGIDPVKWLTSNKCILSDNRKR
jgi:hypothetical protein